MKRRGTSLVMVMGIATAVLLLAFAVANLAVFNLHFSTAVDRREHARNLAMSAVHIAIARIVEHEDYGTHNLASEDVRYQPSDYPGESYGFLTFRPGATLARMFHSTNNHLSGFKPGANGRQVPANTAQLIAVGVCGDVRVQLECIFSRPPFPKGVSSTGETRLDGVTLLGLAPGVEFSGDWTSISDADKRAANVFSNANSANALQINSTCTISGGAGARGVVSVAAGAKVSGEVRSHALAQDVPVFVAQSMLDRMEATGSTLPNWDLNAGTPIDDYVLLTNPPDVTHDIELAGGVLGIRGNLRLTNGATIKGRGAVIVSGQCSLAGGATLAAGRQCALVADGKVTLVSANQNNFFFQGLVYSGHSIEASGVTVVGAVIANGDRSGAPPGPGSIQLTNSRIIQTPIQVQGRAGLPKAISISGSEMAGSDGSDSAYFHLYSQADPTTPGKFLYYGHCYYRASPISEGPPRLPSTVSAGIDVHWVPPAPGETRGKAVWRRLAGEDASFIIPNDGIFDYDGSYESLVADLQRVFNADSSSPYWTRVEGTLTGYVNALNNSPGSGEFLEFNLNRLMTPGEDARIVYVREL